jgi:cytochrome c biogenesis protein CcdA
MKKAVRDSLTGLDGQSYAVAKVMGVAIVATFLGLSIASFVTGKPFDMQAFGIGAGAAVAAMGAAIKLTETSEPKQGGSS